MGIKNAQNSSLLSDLPASSRDDLELYPGGQNELWDELINVRMQFDGNYRHIKHRGGLVSVEDFFGQVRTIKGFSAYAGGVTRDYIVVHTALGNAFLLNKTDHIDGAVSPSSIFADGTFNTTGQVSIFHSGTVIYIFDFIDEVYKVYDIETQTPYDWLSNQSTSISDWQWNEQGDWTDQNIWGFKEGADVFVLQNFTEGAHVDSETLLLSYRSFRATIDTIKSDEILYLSEAGVVRSSSVSEYIGMIHATPDTEDYNNYRAGFVANGPTVQGSFQVLTSAFATNLFYLYVGNVRVPSTGVISVGSSDGAVAIAQQIEQALQDSLSVRALWRITRDEENVFLDRLDSGEQRTGITFDVIKLGVTDLVINANNPIPDQIPAENPDYTEPVVYRGYVMVDLLVDGSYAMPGRPVTVLSTLVDILRQRRTSVTLDLPSPDTNVEKRYLFASRWQTSDDNVFNPSRPDYPNNAFFLAKEVDLTQTSVTDRTEDSKLSTPLSGFIQMSGGIPEIFGPGQLTPTTGGSYKGALFLGGYKINRPTPQVYTNKANPDDKNINATFLAGTPLTGDPIVHVKFEYTDGKTSDLINTGFTLTDASTQLSPGLAETNASLTFDFTQGPQPASGTPLVSFKVDSQPSQEVSFEADAAATTSELATELVNYINGGQVGAVNYGAGIDNITATAVGSGVVFVEWDIPGNAGNFESVTISHLGGIEIDGNSASTVKDFTGGFNEVPALSVSGSRMQLHSLNGLVSKVYIVAKLSDDSYKVLQEIESSAADFHGKDVYLPNTNDQLAAAPDYTPTQATPVTVAELSDGIVMATPFNQPLITEQFRVENSERIVSIVPTQFDVDKTQLRFRMTVFTDRSVQIGYVILDGTAATFDFEVIGAGVAVTNRYGAWRVEGNVVYQARDGIYVYSQNQAGKIIDRYQYDILSSDLKGVIYNRAHGEYWLLFDSSKILVTNIDGSVRKIFDYSAEIGPIRSGTYTADTLLLAIGSALYKGDVAGSSDDFNPIVGELISAPIGDYRTQTKILEVAVAGQDLDAEVGLDLSEERLERTQLPWDKAFEISEQSLPKELYIHGTPFSFHRRGVMPRVRIKTTGDSDGFISHISLTHVMTENKGKAR